MLRDGVAIHGIARHQLPPGCRHQGIAAIPKQDDVVVARPQHAAAVINAQMGPRVLHLKVQAFPLVRGEVEVPHIRAPGFPSDQHESRRRNSRRQPTARHAVPAWQCNKKTCQKINGKNVSKNK
jgi:hypothetical protein